MKLIDLKDEFGLTTAQAEGKEKIGGWLNLSGTQITSLPDNLTVGGWLDLRGTQITSLPDNLTVGGWLYLSGTQITSLPDNLTVGDWLDLRGTQITSLPDNLTVGGSLDLRGTQIKNPKKERAKVKPLPDGFTVSWRLSVEAKLTWKNGKYRIFDGIFCEVLRKLKNAFKVKVGTKIQYVVTDGEHYSHGDTIKQAKADLIYKISNRDTSQYADLTLDSVVTKAEAIKMYRVITGACEAGTKHFVSGLTKTKAKYTIAELIKLTAGQYGNETFAKFFEGK